MFRGILLQPFHLSQLLPCLFQLLLLPSYSVAVDPELHLDLSGSEIEVVRPLVVLALDRLQAFLKS
ncbi:hypothetical protein M7I_0164 [Glarea lozoyensis 74030]|uniref:Secreted protein n=1 Tax=Glarea lozoyensis (strain ATCC 74030 / MF5533) TaxID=1104152 RepID=H0ECM2_GLAL7|nr:hypothetical protein M7I_0164 [Glarea lozoyensis 74030]